MANQYLQERIMKELSDLEVKKITIERELSDLQLDATGDGDAIKLRKIRREYEAKASMLVPVGPWDADFDAIPELGQSCQFYLDEGYSVLIRRYWNMSWDVELIYTKDHWANTVNLCGCDPIVTPFHIIEQKIGRIVFNTAANISCHTVLSASDYVDIQTAEEMAITLMNWLKNPENKGLVEYAV
jgi:hypothetical protein